MSQAPDYAEVVVGWRAWIVGPGPVLLSMNGTPWEPGEKLSAECGKSHDVPDESCSCGIYSAGSCSTLSAMTYGDYNLKRSDVRVVGEVSLWGGVIPAEWGYRAQLAYPKRLFVPYEGWRLAKPLRERYGVPVKLANIYELSKGEPTDGHR